MNMTGEFASGRASMRLDDRLPEGHVVLCTGNGSSEHSFLVRRLGLSVECPKCGHVALSVDLVADFYKRATDNLSEVHDRSMRRVAKTLARCDRLMADSDERLRRSGELLKYEARRPLPR